MRGIKVSLVIVFLLIVCGIAHVPIGMRQAQDSGSSFWARISSSGIVQGLDCARVAHAYEFLVSSGGNYLRWESSDIPIDFKISTWWLPDATEPVGAVYWGVKAWEDVATSSVSFNYQGTTSDTLTDEEDGVNMIGWNAEAWIPEPYGETFAFGATYILWFDTETLYYDECDIALNIASQWTTTGGANKLDIQGLVTHEIGHLLGLAHTDWEVEYGYLTAAQFTALYPERSESTMTSGPTFFYSHTYEETFLWRTLEEDDIAGISVLYPPGYASAGGGGAGGGCFIATAAYGTPFAREVRILSRFRDDCLLENRVGELFIKGYCKISPHIAEFVKNKPLLKRIIRWYLRPVVFITSALLNKE